MKKEKSLFIKNLKNIILFTLIGITPWVCIYSVVSENGRYRLHSAIFAVFGFISIILLLLITRKQNLAKKRKKEMENRNRFIEGKKMWNVLDKRYRRLINRHLSVLSRKKEQCSRKGDYNEIIFDNEAWNQELNYFIEKVLHEEETELYDDESMSSWLIELIEKYDNDKNELRSLMDEYVLYEYGCSIYQQTINIIEGEIEKYHTEKKSLPLRYDKSMTPFHYETFCSELLNSNGWDARVTRKIGDQGVDIVANKENVNIVVQCKKYSGNVTNKAVQEIHAGKDFYDANFAAVVTNSTYTESAKKLSNSLDVLLLHHEDLRQLDVVDGVIKKTR